MTRATTLLSRTPRRLAAAALFAAPLLAAPAFAAAQAPDTRPIVAVLSFDNNSIGKDARDYDGMGKGVEDLLIADMASNPKIRLVDRERIQKVLDEQSLVKAGSIDPTTAVRVGKILGAQYVIYGGFMSDGRGNIVLTAHSTDLESSQIQNPQKVQQKSDDVLGLVAQMSTKLAANLKLESKPGMGHGMGMMKDTAKVAQAGVTGAPVAKPATEASAQQVETFAKPMAPATRRVKLDAATMRIYSNALDQLDHKNTAKAIELFKQVQDKAPNFAPASEYLQKLTRAG